MRNYFKFIRRRSLTYQVALTVALSALTFGSVYLASRLNVVKSLLYGSIGNANNTSIVLNLLLLGLVIFGLFLYSLIDYRQHVRPLREAMPTIIYTPTHYVRVVFLPRAKHAWKSAVLSLSRITASSAILLATFVFAFVYFVSAAPGSLTVTINQKSGVADPNPSYTSVFTVQFNEAINPTTFTSTDLTLAGTATGQQVQSITEAGSFNKSTYEVRIQATGAGTITPSISAEQITAQNGASGTNQASTSSDNSVTFSGDWAQDEFVTTWKTDNPGVTTSTQIQIPTSGGGYNYSVNWGDGNTSTGQTGSATHTYASAGTYTVKISGTFPLVRFNGGGDKQKILTVEQWGTSSWASDMSGAFKGALNLQVPAIDAPNLQSVVYLNSFFSGASNFNSNINHWDVSNVLRSIGMFREAVAFNQPLNAWDTQSLTDTSYMFSDAQSFNQSLSSWSVSSVNNMHAMFANSVAFNQPLNAWDTQSLTDTAYMFASANDFNQPLNNWDTANVTSMYNMFGSTIGGNFLPLSDYSTSFNQPLNNWDTANVTRFDNMFLGNTSFNQHLNSWDASSATTMAYMFANATAFNKPLNRWNTGNVTSMAAMFEGATSFDRSLASWDVSGVTNMLYMFSGGSGLSTANYDATLIGWSSQALQPSVNFFAGTSTYCKGLSARQSIISTNSWTIGDGGSDCTTLAPIVSTLPVIDPESTTATLNGLTSPEGVTERGFEYGNSVSYGQAVQDSSEMRYQIKTSFGEISTGSNGERLDVPVGSAFDSDGNYYIANLGQHKIDKYSSSGTFIASWGSEGSGDGQFQYPSGIAIDSSDNVYVADGWVGDYYFEGDPGKNHRIQKFDSNGTFITKWGSEGSGDGQFQYPSGIAIDSNDNVYVVDSSLGRVQQFDANGVYADQWAVMGFAGYLTITIDGSDNLYVGQQTKVSKFDTSGNLSTSWGTFGTGNGQFHQINNIATDNEGNVYTAEIINGSTGRIQKFDSDGTFLSISSTPEFEGDLSIPAGIAIDKTYGYLYVADTGNLNKVDVYAGLIQASPTLTCNTTYHFRAYATNGFITTYGDDDTFTTAECPPVEQSPFIVRVKTDIVASSSSTKFVVPANTDDYAYNYTVDCNSDGTPEFTGQTSEVTCDYGVAGEYDISISGTYPHMFDPTGDAKKIIDVKQWGTIAWQDMSWMFFEADNIQEFSATDTPDLSNVLSMQGMFAYADVFNSNIESWDVSNVTNISEIFSGALVFNQPLNNWDTSSVTDMTIAFYVAQDFNQPLNGWDTSSVTNLSGMFNTADAFNQPLNNWDTSSVTDMSYMFFSATSFNQNIDSWDTANVTSIDSMFMGASSFNQPLNSWDTSSVVVFQGAFFLATSFNQTLSNWDLSAGDSLYGLFAGASSFNQPIGGWDTSNITNLSGILVGASSFDQSLAGWDVSNVISMVNVFGDAGGYFPAPSGLSTLNYDATLISWSSQNLEDSITFDAGTSKYCNSEAQRQSIIDNKFWTINDRGKDCVVELGIPQNLSGTPYTSSIELDWDDVSTADSYVLQYKQSTSGTWTEYTDNVITGSYLELSGLQSETSYNVRVKAVDNEDNESDWSDTLTISTLGQQTYQITNCEELQAIAINRQTFEFGDASGNYILANDIDCSDTVNWGWEGYVSDDTANPGFISILDIQTTEAFTGNFDGAGHTISGIFQRPMNFGAGGLFASVANSTISNTKLTNVEIRGGEILQEGEGFVGGVIGIGVSSDISNVSVTGTIGATAGNTGLALQYGGLAGMLALSEVNNSSANVQASVEVAATYNPSAPIPTGLIVGGLVGTSNNNRLANSYSLGQVATVANDQFVVGAGGLVGAVTQFWVSGESPITQITKSYAATNITTEGSLSHVGGLIGLVSEIWDDEDNVVGIGELDLSDSFAYGQLNQGPEGGMFGGLIAAMQGDLDYTTISNNYYDSSRTAQDTADCIDMVADRQGAIVTDFNIGCSPVNQNNTKPSYFFNNVCNPPLDKWDFSAIWKVQALTAPAFTTDSAASPKTCSTTTPVTPPTTPTTPTTPPNPTTPTKPTVPTTPNKPRTSDGPTTKEDESSDFVSGLQQPGSPVELPAEQVLSSWWVRVADKVAGGDLGWLLILILLLLGLIYGYRAYREYLQTRALQQVAKQAKLVHDSVKRFTDIAVHYLNTPLAIMKGAVELAVSLHQVPKAPADLIVSKLAIFNQVIAGLTTAVTSKVEKVTASVNLVSSVDADRPLRRDGWLWAAIGIAATSFSLAWILLAVRGTFNKPFVILAIQIFCLVAIAGLTFFTSRFRTSQSRLRAQLKQNIQLESDGLGARREFLGQAASQLNDSHQDLELASKYLPAVPALRTFQNGLAMLTGVTQSMVKIQGVGAVSTDAPLINLSKLVEGLVAGQQAEAAKQQVTITVNVPDNLEVQLQPEEANQLLGSLLQNAVKFNKQNGRVQVRAKYHGKRAVVTIEDTGIGIAAEESAKIFEPFSRATSSEQLDYQGLGLNMYTNKLIAEKHGGRLSLDSGNGGTVVRLELPKPKLQRNQAPQLISPQS